MNNRWMNRLLGRDDRIDELEARSNQLIVDIREQSHLSITAARELRALIEQERQRRDWKGDQPGS